MPKWTPKKVWNGQDVFIIGGGRSLEYFDWTLLKGRRTVGCNDAFQKGVDICKVCVFGDMKWFRIWRDRLLSYRGTIFTNLPKLYKSDLPWLWTTPRITSGLSISSITWNFSTGSAAISLALLLGARRVYLLGFDMKLLDGKNNWHKNRLDKPNPEVFEKFIRGMKAVNADLHKFPGSEIFNITNDSDLNVFPKISCNDFWKKELKIA